MIHNNMFSYGVSCTILCFQSGANNVFPVRHIIFEGVVIILYFVFQVRDMLSYGILLPWNMLLTMSHVSQKLWVHYSISMGMDLP